MYKYYDLAIFHQNLGYLEDRNPLSRLRNKMVEALNKHVKLPKYMVIMLDHNLLSIFHNKPHCKKAIYDGFLVNSTEP